MWSSFSLLFSSVDVNFTETFCMQKCSVVIFGTLFFILLSSLTIIWIVNRQSMHIAWHWRQSCLLKAFPSRINFFPFCAPSSASCTTKKSKKKKKNTCAWHRVIFIQLLKYSNLVPVFSPTETKISVYIIYQS